MSVDSGNVQVKEPNKQAEAGEKQKKTLPVFPESAIMTHSKVKTGRANPDFIEGFMHYTEGTPTGKLFRLWGGINTVLGALTRRVWTVSAGLRVYPNLYTFFIGKPGTGKDVVINSVESLWNGLNGELVIGPRSISPKGLLDTLGSDDCARFYSYKNESGLPIQIEFRQLILSIPELGTTLASYDPKLLSFLNDLYGREDDFKDKVRGNEMVSIPRPCLHVMLGTQPDFLGETFKDTAFGMGTFSRLIMVYSAEIPKVSLWGGLPASKRDIIRDGLVSDLRQIVNMTGEFQITQGAKDLVTEWYEHKSILDAPTHAKLENYNSRRILHLLKLSIAFSVSRSNEMVITEEDWNKAYTTLLYTESQMPGVFSSMTSGRSDNSIIEEVILYVKEILHETGKPVSESKLVKFMARKLPAQSIGSVIDTMVKSKRVRPLMGKNQERYFDIEDLKDENK